MKKRRREVIALRSLQSSDLGIFAAHRSSASSKQRAININSRIAQVILSPSAFRKGGAMVDCICSFQGEQERSKRHFGKVHKNWRLGGNKIEGDAFVAIDSADFALIRSVSGNDGSTPICLTFVSRKTDRRGHASVAALVDRHLKQSMCVFSEDEQEFAELASYFPASADQGDRIWAPPQVKSPVSDEAPIPPMPRPEQGARKRTLKEKIHSPHIVEQMLKMSGDMSASAQLEFLDTVEQLASQLRMLLLHTGGIIKIERDHSALWKSVAGKKIGFVDGGMANLSMLGSSPVAVRVGGYIVTPGDRSSERELFIPLKMLISELYMSPDGSVYDGSFPDLGALRDAARISIEAAGGAKVVSEHPDVSYLFMHGALVNPVSRYTDVMKDGRTRYAFPNFSPTALTQLLPQSRTAPSGKDANFISVYLKQLEMLQSSDTIVCGVVERESHTASVIKQVIASLDEETIRPLLSMPPEAWKHWFLTAVDPSDDDEGQGQRITDPLLFRCVLEPGEALRPVKIDRNEERRAPEAWKDEIKKYPAPYVSYIQPTEWNAPIRMEIFENDLGRFQDTACLVMHCALLLPRYAFPVGLDIVDKFAKIPNWMSNPINTNTAVQALKKALDRGDTRLFDSLRRMMCGSQREWLLRPNIHK